MAGLGGIECIHDWISPDGVEFAINELEDRVTGDPVWPRFRIAKVNHGFPSPGDTSHKKVGRHGSKAHPDYRGSRNHIYTIEVMGRDIDELREGEEALRQAFVDQSAEGRMDVNRHPLNPGYDASANRYFNAKALALDPPDDDDEGDLSPHLGFRREWVLGLRNHAGVYYEEVVDRTNLATNPKLGTDATLWTNDGFDTVARTATPGGTSPPQSTALRVVTSSDVTQGDFAYLTVPVVSGHTYHFSFYVRRVSSSGTPGFAPNPRLEIRNASNVLKANDIDSTGDTNAWVRFDVGVTADSTGNWRFGVAQYSGDAGATGQMEARVTGVLVEEAGTLDDYFDGDSDSARWTGTEELSTSEELVSVDYY